jgi:exodeoxyribonuclease-5
MKLTDGQQNALDQIRGLQKTSPQGGAIGVVSGAAGTGKTTLIRELVNDEEDGLLVCCPTGKASVRVREASGAKSKTIHSWLYEAKEDPENGTLKWGLREPGKIERPRCGYLVIDEASMVTFGVFRDLFRRARDLELNLILIGDGHQLPPVEMDPQLHDFSVFSPDLPAAFRVNLTEIHRQALDSPIIRASMGVRLGQFPGQALAELPIVLESALTRTAAEAYAAEGATICHRNVTRHQLNSAIREYGGRTPDVLDKGEPLLVAANNYLLEVFNGEVVTVLTTPAPINTEPVGVRDANANASCFVNYLEVQVDTPLKGRQVALVADREVFGTLGSVAPFAARKAARRLCEAEFGHNDDGTPAGPPYLQAHLGYVLTTHKAQGSEWTHGVVVIEPTIKLGSADGRRWAYTALTRFKKEVKLCWMRS